MRNGGMRHNVDVLIFNSVKNEYGEEVKTWVVSDSIKAQVINKGGSVSQDGTNKIDSDINLEIQTWNLDNINYTNRLVFDGITYQIDFIDKGYDERKLKINCSKIR